MYVLGTHDDWKVSNSEPIQFEISHQDKNSDNLLRYSTMTFVCGDSTKILSIIERTSLHYSFEIQTEHVCPINDT